MAEKRTFVLGLGLSGRSACAFLRQRHATVFAYDDALDQLPLDSVRELEQLDVQLVRKLPEQLDYAVVSPGVHPQHRLYQTLVERKVPIIGEAELGLKALRSRVVGVTGTNGKTTVTCLLAHVLNQCGFQAVAIGNVGTPITAQAAQLPKQAIAVVELSSYQLETMQAPTLDCAVLLNLAPDHLDRHGSFAAYCQAKRRIIDCLKPSAPFFVYKSCSQGERNAVTFAVDEPAAIWTDMRRIICNQKIDFILQPSYREIVSQERENVLAAYAVCRHFDVSPAAFFAAMIHFSRPLHRLEVIGECEGVTYINDSKGTNPAAVQRALRVTKGPITLIAGGRAKTNEFGSWIPWLQGKVNHICAIGESALDLKQQLEAEVPVTMCASLEEAVAYASCQTAAGGTVLLSPGGSSFDMFHNFEKRGECFTKIVKSLISKHNNNHKIKGEKP